MGSKFFPFKLTPFEKSYVISKGKVASPENVSIDLNHFFFLMHSTART